MKLSVVVPVLNEEASLGATLGSLRESAEGHSFELLVVDGGSTDGSLDVARQLAGRVLESRPGRAAQMHLGATQATGDVLLFLHADTRLPHDWPSLLRGVWEAAAPPAAAAFRLSLDAGGWRYRLVERASRMRSALTGVPLGDQAISVRRDVYLSVGGFPDVPLMEEYYLLRKLKRRGRVAVLEHAVLTSARRHRRNGPIRNGLMNNLITALFFCGVPPRALARLYK